MKIKEFGKSFYSKNRSLLNASLVLFLLTFALQLIIFGQFSPTKLPVPFLLFLSLCTLFRPYFAAGITFALEVLFLRIHYLKSFHTRTALNAIDLFEFKQAAALKGYVDYPLLMIGLVLTTLTLVGLYKFKFNWRLLPVSLLFAFGTYTDIKSEDIQPYGVINTLETIQVEHFQWNWRKNLKRHGILTHLSQTSAMVQIPRAGKHNFFEKFKAAVLPKKLETTNPDIFFVMCESCFTTFDDKFQTPILELENHGYESTTVISPKYGGGTADVEFEALTGLPSDNLNGIKYQFYGDYFAKSSRTLPRILSEIGYLSLGFHNFTSAFWRRNEVYPRFGFKQSFFLEDMNWTEGDNWRPEDSVLYKSVLAEYSKNLDSQQSLFFFMITMFSHGEYEPQNGDHGEKSYKDALKVTTDDLLTFQREVEKLAAKRNRPAYIIVFGDHKPSLSEVFKKYGVLAENEEDEIELGKVPLFIKAIGEDQLRAKKFIQEVTLKPVYCLPSEIIKLTQLSEPFYASLSEVCDKDLAQLIDDKWMMENFPKELYGEILFNDILEKQEKTY